MALSFIPYTGDGSQTQFNVTFGYLSRNHVYVSVDGTNITDFTWLSDTLIELGSAPALDAVVQIRRISPTSRLVDFQNGSVLNAETDLDTDSLQLLYLIQELQEVTVGLIEPSGTVDTTDLADGAVTNAKLADMPEGTIKARRSAGSGPAQNITATQARDLLELQPDDVTIEITDGQIGVKPGSLDVTSFVAGIQIIPTGAMIDFAGSSAPTGWKLCDGTAYDRTDTNYAALFAVIGTTFGAGGGGNDFQVPDKRGRGSIGAGTGSGLTARTLGTAGGYETHTLTEEELPSHTHGVPTNNDDSAATGNPRRNKAGASSNTITSDATGGDMAHNNMPPYLVTNVIIKL